MPSTNAIAMTMSPPTSITGLKSSNSTKNGYASQPAAPLPRAKQSLRLVQRLSARPRCQRLRCFASVPMSSGASVQHTGSGMNATR
ncbi:MAG: hypothetical protein WD944_08245 [Steroidobacteraceae bacterium]